MREVVSLLLVLALACGCATIDVRSEVTILPRAEPDPPVSNEQLISRDFVADYVQIGPRVLVEIHEHRTCVRPRHRPVVRVEHVHRSNRNFVIWDFTLGVLTGGFSALAFARPQMFANRLVDGQGRELHDYSGAYLVGGVFAGISAILLTVGIVDAVRSRDTSHYADAYELERGPALACANMAETGEPLRTRAVTLRVGDDVIVLDGETDERGRVRFELPAWGDAELPSSGQAPAVIEVGRLVGDGPEPRVLVFSLWVPYEGLTNAQAGVADTRVPPTEATLDLGPTEGPTPEQP